MAKKSDLNYKQIYEIFRTCRLCGLSGGYKMPIIPSAAGLDYSNIDFLRGLPEKIRECLQLEVQEGDSMPPLICELCVDKVNDFYEFLEVCRQTNKRTRQQLGLPMTPPKVAPKEECILGVTEPSSAQSTEKQPPPSRLIRPVKVRDDGKADKNDNRAKMLREQVDKLITRKDLQISKVTRGKNQDSIAEKSQDITDSSPATSSKKTSKVKESDVALSQLKVTRETRAKNQDTVDSSSSNSSRRSSSVREQDISLSQLKEQKKSNKSRASLKRENESKAAVDESEDDSSLVPPSKKSKWEKLVGQKVVKPKPEAKPPVAKPEKEIKNIEALVDEKKIKLKIKYQDSSPAPPTPVSRPGPKCSKVAKTAASPATPPVKAATPAAKAATPAAKAATPAAKAATPAAKAATPAAKTATPAAKTATPSGKTTTPSGKNATPSVKTATQTAKTTPTINKGRAKRPRSPTPPPITFPCLICGQECASIQGLATHSHKHSAKFTNSALACNSCGEWFLTNEETAAHHKWHKNTHAFYTCTACGTKYRQFKDYERHVENAGPSHVPWTEVPDVKCEACWKEFPTQPLLEQHKCGGVDSRPGGKCSTCSKYYSTQKSLKKHETACAEKKKAAKVSELKVEPRVRASLLPAQVRVAKCDPVLRKGPKRNKRCKVTTLPLDFGLDPRSVYPYRSLVKVKREPLEFNSMVSINKEIRDEFYKEEDYVHWDSENSSDSESESSIDKKRKVPSLTALSMKTIFSRRCLGKVPKKLRKVKQDKFDSIFDNDVDNVTGDIDSAVDNLGLEGKCYENNKVINSEMDNISESLINNDTDSVKDNAVKDAELLNSEVCLDTGVSTKEDTNGDISENDGSVLKDKNTDDELVKKDTELPKDTESEFCMDTESSDKDSKNADGNDTSVLNRDDGRNDQSIENQNDGSVLKDKNTDDILIDDSIINDLLDTGGDKSTADSITSILDTNKPTEHATSLLDTIKEKAIAHTIESLVETNEKPNGNKEILLENLQDENSSNKQNGCLTANINGSADANDLLSEINELYDKKLMEELDAEIGL